MRVFNAFPRPVQWAPWILLLLVSASLRFWRLAFPGEVAFDESLVGHFSSFYFSGQYYFDIHPPHIKLFYAFLAWLGDMPADYRFPAHETPYPSSFYILLRAFPALCGSLIPLVAAALAREAGARNAWALAIGWALALDSAMIVESRFILNDTPLLFFGSAGWLLLSRWRGSKKTWQLALAAFCLAVAPSIKWTGLGFLIPALGMLAYDFYARPSWRLARAALILCAGALAWQAAGFYLHFQLLWRPGPGSSQMSEPNSRLLLNRDSRSTPLSPLSVAAAAVELNQSMASAAKRVGPHPYASPWFSWPFGWKGIYFWNDRAPGETARIYMLPNLAVWWVAAFAMARLLLNLAPKLAAFATRRPHRPIGPQSALLAFAFLINWAPFALIDRPMFLYHYFPALLISLIALARQASSIERPRPFIIAWVTLIAAFFFWLSPLVYGHPLSEAQYRAKMFLASWL